MFAMATRSTFFPWRSKMTYAVTPGQVRPLGSTVDPNGVNFAIFSQSATAVTLLVFEAADMAVPVQEVSLTNTAHFWHAYLEGLQPGAYYAYRIEGPWDPSAGQRFNFRRLLIDPYSMGNDDSLWNRADACDFVGGVDRRAMDNLDTSLRSAVVDPGGFDWGEDRPLHTPMKDSIIYEMHVRGFTRHHSSGVANPGTFLGIVEKIPYLKALGITAVELLPVFEFDGNDVLRQGPDGADLCNYWGYSTMSFFAPHRAFCKAPGEIHRLDEFRQMVKALHSAGIEVVLDVVFNHTDEGSEQGPTINFRGIDNAVYYQLSQNDRQYYQNYSGCGNTFNCNHPIGEKFIVQCLEHWVRDMHVDGFRFDEGTILTLGLDGNPTRYAPVVWSAELSDVLADTKLIAEAWDAKGDYELGQFPAFRWSEWNGRFRDDIRRFVKGDPGLAGAVANRVGGSSDLYQPSGHLPTSSINFVVCHDGFTLNDLVSYDTKHNEANGEGNTDGIGENLSWNCGIEGPSTDLAIESLRERQIRNFTAIQFLCQGVPMILSGDEIRRTQRGNNNAYCQDNEISWFDWDSVNSKSNTLRFFQGMIAFRKANACLRRGSFFDGKTNGRGIADISWHGTSLNQPDWSPIGRVLAFTMGGVENEPDLHVILNMYWDGLDFQLPQIPGKTWQRVVDTQFGDGTAILPDGGYLPVPGLTYMAQGRTVVVLAAM